MGVLNVTPDSFSDGGSFIYRDYAIAHAISMAGDGADIIDVGGESTRPGAAAVSIGDEIKRVIPVIEGVVKAINVPVSIDTRKSEVARAAIDAGAAIVNDVSGLTHDRGMAAVIQKSGAGAIIMHMRGTPADMQEKAAYNDVVEDVIMELGRSLKLANSSGIEDSSVAVDPGIGFAKDFGQNIEILKRLWEFKSLGRPLCVGVSRKAFIGKLLGGVAADKRLHGTVAACVAAIMSGADILRVHDVKEVKEASIVADAIVRLKGS